MEVGHPVANTRLLTLILTSVKNEEAQRVIESTWANEARPSVFITDKLSEAKSSQWSLTEDTRYASNEVKVVKALNMAREFPFYNWVLLCDDDTVPNYTAIRAALPHLSEDHVHGRMMFHQWRPDPTLDYPSGGAGTLFPMKLLKALPPLENLKTGYADVSCGLWMRAFNVNVQYQPFKPFHPKMLGLDMHNPEHHGIIQDQWSFHYIKQPNEIAKLHTIFHGENEPCE